MFAVVLFGACFSCGVRVFALRRRSVACELQSAWFAAASARLRRLGVLAATEPTVNAWRGPPVALLTVKVDTRAMKKYDVCKLASAL